ncbi:hypothetical protein LLH06_04005 [Mucilaginibacter daejeonensis]|uniref:hypothetical protein n=1 Tax=Mucilaginibacter daejeonensis TaxID=398049 RepID=UPI001D172500|nr:hypothetical protein [Mucilaginibacter daejeonensis]UEG54133.1 hypothetical protein LLH06_04005 [Mucilaginibacter daejeonensis]
MTIRSAITTFHLLLLCMIGISVTACAQQAKAYDIIQYTAKAPGMTLRLSYADGYLAASKVTISQPKQTALVLMPQSGTPEANGDLIFEAQNKTGEPKVTLYHIDEAAEAPKSITGKYLLKGRTVSLLFKNK